LYNFKTEFVVALTEKMNLQRWKGKEVATLLLGV